MDINDFRATDLEVRYMRAMSAVLHTAYPTHEQFEEWRDAGDALREVYLAVGLLPLKPDVAT